MGSLTAARRRAAWLLVAATPALATDDATTVAPGDLARALARAQPGATLRLAPGVHPGPLVVDVAIRLEGKGRAVIAGDGHGTVVELTADGIELDGVTVRGGGDDLGQDDAAIRLHQARGIGVTRCRIEARAFGIYVRGGGEHRLRANEIQGDAALAPARRGNGIHLWHTERNEVIDNQLSDVRDGVYLSFAHRNLIRGNAGEGLRYGIHYMYSEENRLIDNRFHRSTGGIALMFSRDNYIARNQTIGNRRFGILCQQLEGSQLEANRARGNGRGLYLENSARNRLIANTLAGNGVGIFLTAGTEANVITGNSFSGNLVQVYSDHAGGNQWSAAGRGNRWSDYAGFDWDGDGVGETPYRLHTASAALMARRPQARWFASSPMFALLDWWESRLPRRGASGGALDRHPLVGAVPATP